MISDGLSLACPECGSLNTLTSRSLPKDINIHCSSCRASLGRWDLLAAQTGTQGLPSDSRHDGARKPQ